MTTSRTGTLTPTLNKEEGYTLVELLVVGVIFSLLVALSAPLFSRSWKAWARSTCTEDVLSLLELARARSVLEQTVYGVQFDPVKKAYWLVRRDRGENELGLSRVSEKWGRTRVFPSDIDLQSDQTVAVFYPNGTAETFTLDLVPHDGRRVTLQVQPILGQASVIEHAT